MTIRMKIAALLLTLAAMGWGVEAAHALSLGSVGLSGGLARPMGFQYQAFDGGWHVGAEIALEGLSLGSNLESVMAIHYQGFNLRTVQSAGYHIATASLGLIAYGGPTGGKGAGGGLKPFFGVLVGGAVDWLTFRAPQVNMSASVGASIQLQPGLAYSLTDSFEVRATTTVQTLFLSRNLWVFQPALGVRYRL